MDIEQFRKAGYEVIDRICDYYQSIADRSVVAQVEPGYLGKLLPLEAPQKGESFDAISKDFQNIILPGITHWQHPSFFAYFPANATFPGILADIYASSVSNPGFNWTCSPACTELEAIVMDWAAKLLGLHKPFHVLSEKGGGVIQGSASESALTAIIAARSRFKRAHPDVAADKLVIYATTQTHSLAAKAALILDVAWRALPVTAEDNFALVGKTFRTAYDEDIKSGRHPFVLVVTMGTTSSGAFDKLDDIGPIAKQVCPDLWIHVDAAWAGVALSCPEYRPLLQLDAINHYADSFCTNFHKWGLVNFDASALWVQDRRGLTDALDVTPEFLRTKHGDAGTVIDYRNWQIALGRRFRSVKLWFVLRSYGTDGFKAHIRKSVKNAEYFADLIRASSDFELVTTPSLALTVFRLVPSLSIAKESPHVADGVDNTMTKNDAQTLNNLNREFFRQLSDRHDIYLTQTDLLGTYCIRMAVGAERTEASHVKHAFDLIEGVGRDVLLKRAN